MCTSSAAPTTCDGVAAPEPLGPAITIRLIELLELCLWWSTKQLNGKACCCVKCSKPWRRHQHKHSVEHDWPVSTTAPEHCPEHAMLAGLCTLPHQAQLMAVCATQSQHGTVPYQLPSKAMPNNDNTELQAGWWAVPQFPDLSAGRLQVQHLGTLCRRGTPAERCLRLGQGAQHGHHGQVHRALAQQGS